MIDNTIVFLQTNIIILVVFIAKNHLGSVIPFKEASQIKYYSDIHILPSYNYPQTYSCKVGQN